MGRLTTHVLDTSLGRPGRGLRIELFALDGQGVGLDGVCGRRRLKETVTNADGRTDQPLLEGAAFTPGIYDLTFHVGDYFASQGLVLPSPALLDVVPVRFRIADAQATITCRSWSVRTATRLTGEAERRADCLRAHGEDWRFSGRAGAQDLPD